MGIVPVRKAAAQTGVIGHCGCPGHFPQNCRRKRAMSKKCPPLKLKNCEVGGQATVITLFSPQLAAKVAALIPLRDRSSIPVHDGNEIRIQMLESFWECKQEAL